MYNCPIDLAVGDMNLQFDGEVLKAIRKFDITVDKDELVKALEYDRDQYCKGYNDAIEKLQPQFPKWISVKERLPEQNTRVIGFMAWKGITAIEYQHGKWYSIDHLQPLPNEAVTHWMPLPQPPKDET